MQANTILQPRSRDALRTRAFELASFSALMLSQILLEDAALCHVLFPGAWMTGAVGHTVRHSCVQRLHVHAHRVQIHDAGLAHPRVHACEGTSGTAMRCRVRALGAWHSVVRERRACMHDVRRDRAVELAAKAVVDSAPCTPAVRRSPSAADGLLPVHSLALRSSNSCWSMHCSLVAGTVSEPGREGPCRWGSASTCRAVHRQLGSRRRPEQVAVYRGSAWRWSCTASST